jgi:hypothetical protein
MAVALAVAAAPATPHSSGPVVSSDSRRAPLSPSPPTIFGTNLGLFDATDRILADSTARGILRAAHLSMVRMPFRSARGDIIALQALRAIQEIGATPLVVIHGADDPTALTDDESLVALTLSVFGSHLVYAEFGNEPDTRGINVQDYLQAWNAVVPQLETRAPSWRFVGPALSVADPAYIATFDQLARPRPYADTWHEYACTPSESNATCVDRLSRWVSDVNEVELAVMAATGRSLPVIFSEWNLDAKPDPRFLEAAFMSHWTALAMQTLEGEQGDGLIAALQYCASNNQFEQLIGLDDQLTPEGEVFFGIAGARSGS